jgi:O-acetyl-ADP-ribose deacetylase (regulator of RNase III)
MTGARLHSVAWLPYLVSQALPPAIVLHSLRHACQLDRMVSDRLCRASVPSANLSCSYTFPAGPVLSLVVGDISLQRVDAIVNPANAYLRHGGGVAAALVRSGGPTIQSESNHWVQEHGPITHRDPAVTAAGNLHCHMIIHVLGPVWGEGQEDAKLADAVSAALLAADRHDARSLAMPAISTGIFGFPLDRAAPIHLDTLQRYFEDHSTSRLADVRLVLLDSAAWTVFADALQHRWPTSAVRL